MEPLSNGANGEGRDDKTGRFLKGCKGGPGNPEAARVKAYRAEFLKAVTPADIRRAAVKLARLAGAGEGWAARELLDRCLGRSKEILAVEIKHEGNLRRGEELLGIIEKRLAPGQEPPK